MAIALMLVVCLAGLAPAGAAAAATWLVDMDNSYSFHPTTRTVARGDVVKWRNKASLQHDVKSDLSGYFTSPGGTGGLSKDETYTRTFKQAGTFGYICRFHRDEGMRGTIVVPIKVTLSGSTFTITVASASASGRWRNRIQVRKPGASSWSTITVTAAKSVAWGSSQHGTFQFRSAVKDTTTGSASGWSPTVSRTR